MRISDWSSDVCSSDLLTVQSLQAYGPSHRHWAVAWSGGKDSTATLTLLVALIRGGDVPAPETLTVFLADTRLELLPLWISALAIMERQIGGASCRERGCQGV